MSGLRSFVVSDGGRPGPRERAIIFKEIYGEARVPGAAVSIDFDNPLTRGLATVLSWLSPGFKVFRPHDVRLAFDHIGVGANVPELMRELELLQRDLPPVGTLDAMRKLLRQDDRAAASE
jgi:hypothetical protein